ncbi:MAG: hypothetical protein ACYC4R_06185 [Anaerolineae bacterium]
MNHRPLASSGGAPSRFYSVLALALALMVWLGPTGLGVQAQTIVPPETPPATLPPEPTAPPQDTPPPDNTPTPQITTVPEDTPIPTVEPTGTTPPESTATPSPPPTEAPTPEPTQAPSPIPTAVPTLPPTEIPPTPTPTVEPTDTPTVVIPSATPTETASPTLAPTETAAPPTVLPSSTPSPSPTGTVSPTGIPPVSPTATAVVTPTPTATPAPAPPARRPTARASLTHTPIPTLLVAPAGTRTAPLSPCGAPSIAALFIQGDDDPWMEGAQVALRPNEPVEMRIWLLVSGSSLAATASVRNPAGQGYALLAFAPVHDTALVEAVLRDALDRGALTAEAYGRLVEALALRDAQAYLAQLSLSSRTAAGSYRVEVALRTLAECPEVGAHMDLQVLGMAGLSVSEEYLDTPAGQGALLNLGNLPLTLALAVAKPDQAVAGQEPARYYADAQGERLALQSGEAAHFQRPLSPGDTATLTFWPYSGNAATETTHLRGLTVSVQME